MDNLNELATRLITLPGIINTAQNSIIDLMEESKTFSNDIDRLEAVIKTEIGSITDIGGKKLYTNAESRDAAFIERSAENQELTDLKTELAGLTKAIQLQKNEVEMLGNEQRNVRAILYFFGGGEK